MAGTACTGGATVTCKLALVVGGTDDAVMNMLTRLFIDDGGLLLRYGGAFIWPPHIKRAKSEFLES
jgi:hypothetical protein